MDDPKTTPNPLARILQALEGVEDFYIQCTAYNNCDRTSEWAVKCKECGRQFVACDRHVTTRCCQDRATTVWRQL